MEKKRKKYNFILYTLLMIGIFCAVMVVFFDYGSFYLGNMLLKTIFKGKYGIDFFYELLLAFLVLIVLLISGNNYIFTEKKEGFIKSILRGWPELILCLPLLIINTISVINDDINVYNLISLVLFAISIGIYEEFMCRGWLQNEFIERFGNTKKGIYLSIITSSIIFGLIHITNMLVGQGLVETILQIISAAAGGFLYGALYYKTKNIWSVVFLHAIWDFSIFLGEYNLLLDCQTVGTMSLGYLIQNYAVIIAQAAYYIFAGILILRNAIKEEENETTRIREKVTYKEKTNKKILLLMFLMLIIEYAIAFIPIDSGTYGEECYSFGNKVYTEYKEVYTNLRSYNVNIEMIDEETSILENFNAIIFINGNEKVEIRNNYTQDSYVLPYENVKSLIVVQNNTEYTVLIYSEKENGEFYYSRFINSKNAANNNLFFDNFSKSFTRLYYPEIYDFGYIELDNIDYKYPLLSSSLGDLYIVDEESSEIKETLLIKN